MKQKKIELSKVQERRILYTMFVYETLRRTMLNHQYYRLLDLSSGSPIDIQEVKKFICFKKLQEKCQELGVDPRRYLEVLFSSEEFRRAPWPNRVYSDFAVDTFKNLRSRVSSFKVSPEDAVNGNLYRNQMLKKFGLL